MATANITLLQQALEAIFDKSATVVPATNLHAKPTVRISRHQATPAEFEALAQTCHALNHYPSVARSGENVTFTFTC